MTANKTPVCSAALVSHWNRAQDSLGVSGVDVVGDNISTIPAERFGPINNWFPLDVHKQTLCGKLQRFSVFDGSSAEVDWNNFIIPDPAFLALYTDALPFKGGEGTYCLDEDWPTCGDEEACIEAEITPHKSFYENPWFRRSTEISPLENAAGQGPSICTYGPWVRECVHGHKPEIHPSELIWWREPFRNADLFWLLQLHDDSNRFDKAESFDCGAPIGGVCPGNWRPWSAVPRQNMFFVTFDLNPNNERVEFNVGQSFSRHVRTDEFFTNTFSDDPARNRHMITYDGNRIVEAVELQPSDRDLKIGYVSVCRNAQNTRLQGRLRIGSAVSRSSDGEEGYHIVFVTRTKRALSPQPPELAGEVLEFDPLNVPIVSQAPRVSLSGEALVDTLRRSVVGGRPQLFGDARIDVHSEAGATATDLGRATVELVGKRQRRSLVLLPEPHEKAGVVASVPVYEAGKLVVTTKSGRRLV